jgi:hypothetical protein
VIKWKRLVEDVAKRSRSRSITKRKLVNTDGMRGVKSVRMHTSNQKTCRTEQYVGCTYQELLDHLESQFEEGMTWKNHGEWQIDHFKAQSSFDPTIEEEKFKCWHYTNLQPMWAEMNIGWGNKKKPGDEFVIWMDREIGWVNIFNVLTN